MQQLILKNKDYMIMDMACEYLINNICRTCSDACTDISIQ